ncbi:MAG: N-acetylmuramoyl-L-alanine amidase [Pseudoflavonifractor sp.]|nr:N-acetylmuramoyl-L-alanine amidase [Pseudoflavonifractor sp.]
MISRFYKIVTVVIVLMVVALNVAAKEFVVVIDAGHGGHDHGAIDNGVREKNINLGVALKLGELIKKRHKDVKVVYTRDDDHFLSLQERANVANRAGGDLFISIHTNSVDAKSKNRSTVKGASTYTLGLHRTAENLAVAKRENSVMMLEKDYTETYCGFDPNSTESYIMFELNQNKHIEQSVRFAQAVQDGLSTEASRVDKGVRQAGFWVLAATGMPAVLVELDFICNPASARFLGSSDGQQKLAKGICKAFDDYKDSYDKQLEATRQSPSGMKSKSGKKDKDKDKERRKKKDTVNDGDAANKVLESASVPDSKDSAKYEAATETAPAGADTDVDKGTWYKVQFIADSEPIKDGSTRFKGLEPVGHYYEKGLHKYTYGTYRTWDEAKKSMMRVRKKFPEAFIITVKDGKRIK